MRVVMILVFQMFLSCRNTVLTLPILAMMLPRYITSTSSMTLPCSVIASLLLVLMRRAFIWMLRPTCKEMHICLV